MRPVKIIIVGAVLAWMGGPAMAFQEQSVTAPKAPPAATPQAAPSTSPLGISEGDMPKKEPGTEIRIPGLGKVGVLPKLDFGLELLYKSADPKAGEEKSGPSQRGDDDTVIRGSVKHRF